MHVQKRKNLREKPYNFSALRDQQKKWAQQRELSRYTIREGQEQENAVSKELREESSPRRRNPSAVLDTKSRNVITEKWQDFHSNH